MNDNSNSDETGAGDVEATSLVRGRRSLAGLKDVDSSLRAVASRALGNQEAARASEALRAASLPSWELGEELRNAAEHATVARGALGALEADVETQLATAQRVFENGEAARATNALRAAASASPSTAEMRRATEVAEAGSRLRDAAAGIAGGSLAKLEIDLSSATARIAAGLPSSSIGATFGVASGGITDELRRAYDKATSGLKDMALATYGLDKQLNSWRTSLAAADLTSGAMRAITGSQIPSAAEMLRIAGVGGGLADVLATGARMRSILDASSHGRRNYEELFRIPRLDEFAGLAAAASRGALAQAAFGTDPSSLHAAMNTMHSPWLREGRLTDSAYGFGELQGMGALLSREPPFAESVSAALRTGLGDWRDEITVPATTFYDADERSLFYVDRGFNRALVDFTPRAFDESLGAAGIKDRPLVATDGEAGDDDEEDLKRGSAAFDRLQRFEREVRRFVDRMMRAAFGEKWVKQRTPPGMRDQWVEKRDAAIRRGEIERPLIEYADFTDYVRIIDRSDNWQQVFQFVFERREDMRESFQRLGPVRICTMHCRTVTLFDELYLISETTRILRAINKTG